jgi:hypothetical protein
VYTNSSISTAERTSGMRPPAVSKETRSTSQKSSLSSTLFMSAVSCSRGFLKSAVWEATCLPLR